MPLRANLFLLLLIASASQVFGQESGTASNDSTKLLNEVVVSAYLYNRPISEVPTAIAVLDQKDFERFNNTSFLPAVNMVPGVRMEERSPGSYRFSIRGSLLRSPFGVRNVKVYWNGLPLTDGGGNTYLNLIDFSALANLEIIKGPGSSLYGASTGGVVLLQNEVSRPPGIKFSTVLGSYGLQRYQLAANGGTEKVKFSLQYAHQQADGYREQTEMRRDAFNADISFALNAKNTLSTTIFYTDLFYETPGGLTKVQYDANPRQARPPKTSPPPLPVRSRPMRLSKTKQLMSESFMTMNGMTIGLQIRESMDPLRVLRIQQSETMSRGRKPTWVYGQILSMALKKKAGAEK
jgi:iron complex outermembrane receptor protein